MALLRKFPGLDLRIWARREVSARQAARYLREQSSGAGCLGTTSLARAVKGAEMVVFCVPIGAMGGLARQIKPHLSPDAACTDVGSVKGRVVTEMEKILGGRFVGAHPMAGSERSGLAAAQPDLYSEATCIITPTERTFAEALEAVALLWWQVGCWVIFSSAGDHDEAVARVSHLPHLLSSLLVNQTLEAQRGWEAFAGSGFRDATRLAGGPEAMWAEILRSNRAEVLAALEEFSRQIDVARRALRAPTEVPLRSLLASARDHRQNLYS